MPNNSNVNSKNLEELDRQKSENLARLKTIANKKALEELDRQKNLEILAQHNANAKKNALEYDARVKEALYKKNAERAAAEAERAAAEEKKNKEKHEMAKKQRAALLEDIKKNDYAEKQKDKEVVKQIRQLIELEENNNMGQQDNPDYKKKLFDEKVKAQEEKFNAEQKAQAQEQKAQKAQKAQEKAWEEAWEEEQKAQEEKQKAQEEFKAITARQEKQKINIFQLIDTFNNALNSDQANWRTRINSTAPDENKNIYYITLKSNEEKKNDNKSIPTVLTFTINLSKTYDSYNNIDSKIKNYFTEKKRIIMESITQNIAKNIANNEEIIEIIDKIKSTDLNPFKHELYVMIEDVFLNLQNYSEDYTVFGVVINEKNKNNYKLKPNSYKNEITLNFENTLFRKITINSNGNNDDAEDAEEAEEADLSGGGDEKLPITYNTDVCNSGESSGYAVENNNICKTIEQIIKNHFHIPQTPVNEPTDHYGRPKNKNEHPVLKIFKQLHEFIQLEIRTHFEEINKDINEQFIDMKKDILGETILKITTIMATNGTNKYALTEEVDNPVRDKKQQKEAQWYGQVAIFITFIIILIWYLYTNQTKNIVDFIMGTTDKPINNDFVDDNQSNLNIGNSTIFETFGKMAEEGAASASENFAKGTMYMGQKFGEGAGYLGAKIGLDKSALAMQKNITQGMQLAKATLVFTVVGAASHVFSKLQGFIESMALSKITYRDTNHQLIADLEKKRMSLDQENTLNALQLTLQAMLTNLKENPIKSITGGQGSLEENGDEAKQIEVFRLNAADPKGIPMSLGSVNSVVILREISPIIDNLEQQLDKIINSSNNTSDKNELFKYKTHYMNTFKMFCNILIDFNLKIIKGEKIYNESPFFDSVFISVVKILSNETTAKKLGLDLSILHNTNVERILGGKRRRSQKIYENVISRKYSKKLISKKKSKKLIPKKKLTPKTKKTNKTKRKI